MQPPCEEAEREGDDASVEVVQAVLSMPRDWLHLLGLTIPSFRLLSENPTESLKPEVSNHPDVPPEDLTPRGRMQCTFRGTHEGSPSL